MKDLISYISKKYQPYVIDFHKEYEDGCTYWLSLKCDGKYHLVDYFSEYTIHEDTLSNALQVLRTHIKEK